MSSAAPIAHAVTAALRSGLFIPAHPLALTAERRLDEERQCALTRYYLDAGVGGLAVGVHTTQFAIREYGMLGRVLELAARTVRERVAAGGVRPVLVAGVTGRRDQALAEARTARAAGYDVALVSLAALAGASEDERIAHCEAVGEVLGVFGFYLQPAVGGFVLGREFWRRLAELPCTAAIKVAPFDRRLTLDVVEGVAASGRAGEVALYTGNDDHIVRDLLADHEPRFVGGLLGHWAVWTRSAVALFEEARRVARSGEPASPELLARADAVTECNAAVFDRANRFAGCIAGVNEVLRRGGLLRGAWCLDPTETLSPGQAKEIDRVCAAYPDLTS
ncbi:MAG: dihydrodipicolinate synthase family protein [Planctomycetota bacterium]|nr:dihydrodipicolinate synthase family protein [Planctomycetota bacterium]